MTRRYYDSTTVHDPERMIVPIAIREDLVARLQIPANLTLAEAKKIARVVLAYASADTRPEGGDATEIAAPFTGGAVPNVDSADAQ